MKSYLINLASRPDRLEQARKELARIGIEAERFEAYTGPNRPLAFNKSQYYCIKKAVDTGHERFAIFEDDVAFTDNAAEVIAAGMREIGNVNVFVLHLGCNIIGMSTTNWEMPKPIYIPVDGSPNFHKLNHLAWLYNCWQTHAMIWTIEAAKIFLKSFPFYTDEYMTEGLMIYDEWLRQHFYPKVTSFVLNPMVAYQRPDFSNINEAHSDYTSCFTLGNEYLKTL